jgi:uncharacterized RDD family membrane protein YckC
MKIHHVQYKPYIKLRIIATLIDYVIYLILFYVYLICMGSETETDTNMVEGWAAMPLFFLWFLYFVGLETINKATPGHDICKLTVVKGNGEPISFGDAFKRRIIDFVDIGIYGIPALICISKTPKHQRLGDLLADTVVVKKSDIAVQEVIF